MDVEGWKVICRRDDVSVSGEAREWLRSKIVRAELGLLKIRVERRGDGGREGEIGRVREKGLYGERKLGDEKMVKLMFGGVL